MLRCATIVRICNDEGVITGQVNGRVHGRWIRLQARTCPLVGKIRTCGGTSGLDHFLDNETIQLLGLRKGYHWIIVISYNFHLIYCRTTIGHVGDQQLIDACLIHLRADDIGR